MCDFAVVSFIILENELLLLPTHGWILEPHFLMGNQKECGDSVCDLLWRSVILSCIERMLYCSYNSCSSRTMLVVAWYKST